MSQSQNPGLMSSGGLVRYFDEQSQDAVLVSPKTILFLSIGTGFVVEKLKFLF